MSQYINEQVKKSFKESFIHLCLEALNRGYEKMVKDKEYDVNWKEDNLTVHLVEKMKSTGFLRSNRISVNLQSPIYDQGVIYRGENPSNAPVVDFKFSKWYQKLEFHYYSEAKNLSESDWTKTDGTNANVNASQYRGRYIDTGINNLVSGRYPEGCLLGYIVQGKLSNALNKLNNLINTRSLPPKIGTIYKDEKKSFPTCYISNNIQDDKGILIYHILMQL